MPSRLSELVSQAETFVEESTEPEKIKEELIYNLRKIEKSRLNILLVGATGAGKSSTINALFNADVAKVGQQPDPETDRIEKYELQNLTLWDTPGLGDGKEADKKNASLIREKLEETDSEGNALIDLVLVILDGSSKDLNTPIEIITRVIIPRLGPQGITRLLVAVNQCDLAAKGRYWNRKENRPEKELEEYLDKVLESIKRRIFESANVDIEPVYYSAGSKDGERPQKPYNLAKLFYYILLHTPKEKRILYVNDISQKGDVWEHNDRSYGSDIQKTMLDSIVTGAKAGALLGGAIGAVFGGAGQAIGSAIGAACGAVCGFFSSWF